MFYDEEPEEVPWDYFLTEYERDLIIFAGDENELGRRYPLVSLAQIEKDIEEMEALYANLNISPAF